jgi:hypothetical protein
MEAASAPIRERSRDWPDGPVRLVPRGIHPRAVNLERSPGGERFSLVREARDMGPRTARIAPDPPEDLRALFRADRVLEIDLTGLPRRFDPRVPPLGGEAVRRFAPLLEEWSPWPEGPDWESCREAVESGRFGELVGLGPGLTPAGDDFLAGWSVGLAALRKGGGLPAGAPGAETLGPVLPEADLARTGWLSASILRDAREGRTWARGKGLIEAMGRGDGEAVLRRAGEIRDFGHTSGRAWLAGFARVLLAGIR